MSPPNPRAPSGPVEDRQARNERNLLRVVKAGIAGSLGLMAAFLQSIEEVHPRLRVAVSPGAAITFLIATAGAWWFWNRFFRAKDPQPRRIIVRALLLFCVVTSGLTVLAFGRSLHGVSAALRSEVVQGTALAVAVLSLFGFLIWRVGRFFERSGVPPSERPTREE